jgi:signal peptidase I
MPHVMNYHGPSMHPTLKPGDALQVLAYGNNKARIGDVIAFRDPQTGRNVVHRVVSIDSRGVRTRGDNNTRIDPWILKPKDIIGIVVRRQRNQTSIKVAGRRKGRIIALVHRTIKQINSMRDKILHPVYAWLSKSGFFIKFKRFFPKMRIIEFHRLGGKEFHLMMGHQTIGRRLPEKDHWQIKRPFKLFVDVTSLPK